MGLSQIRHGRRPTPVHHWRFWRSTMGDSGVGRRPCLTLFGQGREAPSGLALGPLGCITR